MKHLNKLSFLKYWYAKFIIHRGSPAYVARGMATGLFCAFGVPAMQMPIAFVLCILFKGAKIPAVAATWVTNWVTAPVIYPVQLYIGSWAINKSLSWEKIKQTQELITGAETIKGSISILWGLSTEILYSFLAGGVVLGIVWAIAGYFITLFAVRKYRHAKSLRQKKKMKEILEAKLRQSSAE